jgi:hypothetical protein
MAGRQPPGLLPAQGQWMAGFQPLVDELFGERSGGCQRFAERCRTCECEQVGRVGAVGKSGVEGSSR